MSNTYPWKAGHLLYILTCHKGKPGPIAHSDPVFNCKDLRISAWFFKFLQGSWSRFSEAIAPPWQILIFCKLSILLLHRQFRLYVDDDYWTDQTDWWRSSNLENYQTTPNSVEHWWSHFNNQHFVPSISFIGFLNHQNFSSEIRLYTGTLS